MAQGNQNAPQEAVTLTAAQWGEACKAAGFGLNGEGVPEVQLGDMIVPVPVPNFAHPKVMAFVAHGVIERVRNRFLTQINGAVPNDATAELMATGNGAPSPRSNHARDAIYLAKIGELTDAAKGWTEEAIKAMSASAKLDRSKLIESNAASDKNRAKYYDSAVNEALGNGSTAAAKRETKRKAASKVESLEL